MANTRNMIHLMTHAADLLDACDPIVNVSVMARSGAILASVVGGAAERVAREVAAVATASTVLRMVAAAMDDDPDTLPAPSERQPA